MEKEKPYKCEVCGKRYKNLNGLKYVSNPCDYAIASANDFTSTSNTLLPATPSSSSIATWQLQA
jgi:hypothetical protein